MNRSIDEARIAESWLLAWQLRCCPPDPVLAGKLNDELRRHLEICPLCSRDRAEALPPVQLKPPTDSSTEKRQPQTGELWSLQPSLGGWGPKHRYYNPPIVLITGMVEADAVNVVQTSGDTKLAGPDDLLLENGLFGFVEPWNQYTLRSSDLQSCLGKISEQLSTRLRQLADEAPFAPAPGSLLWFFRQMEVETGWFFADQSLADLLRHTEKLLPTSFPNITTDNLLADLQHLPVIIPDIDCTALPEDILARTMPADDLLPLAAAELKPRMIRILLFIVEQGRIHTAEMISGDVTLMDRQESMLHISGCCRSDVPDDAVWIFRWQSGSWSVEPLPGQYGASDGVFWAVFPITDIVDPEQGELIVRILVQR
ncbi:MAG: hypothetical protein U9P36_01230 [Thermodesulfobacteriota bacterium]|nr:hypothetical protein [Thermodesulfobacteriota bacterium]